MKYWCVCVCVCVCVSCSVVSISFVTPWTVAHLSPLSMGFPRQEQWSELPFLLFSRRSSRSRDWTWVSCVAGRFFAIWAPRIHIIIVKWNTDKHWKRKLSERSQPQKTAYCMIPLLWNVRDSEHVRCLVTHLCPILCNSMDCILLDSCVHGDSPRALQRDKM